MWTKGILKIGNSIFTYCVKHYKEASEDDGIDCGRISKLMIERDGKLAYRYDRGLDLAPIDRESEKALAKLLKKFN
ncbi:MAG: hypothetical protein MR209_02945 [Veillonellaceae bacterium]|nr:hypothetical protein [Veillonellaceae bacterium]